VRPAAAQAAQNIAQQISELADQGAKYFLWINMPPFDRIPGQPANADLGAAFGQGSIAFDQEEASEIAQLQNRYTNQGVVIASVDMYALFTSLMNDPTAYGFTNTTSIFFGRPGISRRQGMQLWPTKFIALYSAYFPEPAERETAGQDQEPAN
jgi:phospholipase/lecithinase/hemolysin